MEFNYKLIQEVLLMHQVVNEILMEIIMLFILLDMVIVMDLIIRFAEILWVFLWLNQDISEFQEEKEFVELINLFLLELLCLKIN